MRGLRPLLSAIFAVMSFAAVAADYPPPKQGDFVAHEFKFHNGEVMAELKLHYATVGEPTGQPVLVLHGSGGSAASMLTAGFAGELFGAGQPLDATKYYIIIPDGIGHGKSSKPSDGLKTAFPKDDYDDMVEAQHRLVSEGPGIRHLRLVIGNSMGGMHTWLWAEKYPDMMDVAVPMASQPTAMAAMAMPSISTNGSPSMIMRSAKVPLSPSSALQTMYFCGACVCATVRHLMPVGKPAPPRPRNPDCTTSSTIAPASSERARSKPLHPPCAR